MVHLYYQKTKDDQFLKKALPVLDKEYQFWRKNTTVTIRQGGKKYKLNRYIVNNHSPRPESYVEDYKTVYNNTQITTQQQQDDLFSDLAAGAESGWDYTSRWTKIKETDGNITSTDILRSLDTHNVIPIDLNALLWSMETHLADWHAHTTTKNNKDASYYRSQAKHRLDALDALLWNETQASFFDYNLTSHAQTSDEYTSASLFPFWLGAVPARVHRSLDRVFDLTRRSLTKYPGILTSTDRNTTMQWDLPNGWPPLQYVAIQAMHNVDSWLKEAKYKDLAKVLAERMSASAFCSWYLTGGSIPGELTKLDNTTDQGHMFEKFDVRSLTASGFGGECK
jgi:alpha,alpha-trehalase